MTDFPPSCGDACGTTGRCAWTMVGLACSRTFPTGFPDEPVASIATAWQRGAVSQSRNAVSSRVGVPYVRTVLSSPTLRRPPDSSSPDRCRRTDPIRSPSWSPPSAPSVVCRRLTHGVTALGGPHNGWCPPRGAGPTVRWARRPTDATTSARRRDATIRRPVFSFLVGARQGRGELFRVLAPRGRDKARYPRRAGSNCYGPRKTTEKPTSSRERFCSFASTVRSPVFHGAGCSSAAWGTVRLVTVGIPADVWTDARQPGSYFTLLRDPKPRANDGGRGPGNPIRRFRVRLRSRGRFGRGQRP